MSTTDLSVIRLLRDFDLSPRLTVALLVIREREYEQRPIATIAEMASVLDCHFDTADRALRDLKCLGLIQRVRMSRYHSVTIVAPHVVATAGMAETGGNGVSKLCEGEETAAYGLFSHARIYESPSTEINSRDRSG